jgi:hypothetical protein
VRKKPPGSACKSRTAIPLTPRPILRLQRNNTSLLWRYAIHETLASARSHSHAPPEPLAGAALRHHGYGDDQTISTKLKRNRDIVIAERRQGHDYLNLSVEEARYAEVFTTGASMAWAKVFNHLEAAPREAGAMDFRVEAALSLAEFGNCAPALTLLATNPLMLSLQLAVLAAQHGARVAVDPARLDFLSICARAGLGDWRYSYPNALLGASREQILALVKEMTEDFAKTSAKNKPSAAAGQSKRIDREQ